MFATTQLSHAQFGTYGTSLRTLSFFPTNGTVVAPMGTNFNSLKFTNSVTISPSPQSMLFQEYGLPPYSLLVYNTNTNVGTRGLLVSMINNNNPDSILFHATSKDGGANTNTNTNANANTAVSRFIVLADGKAGINISSPQHTLHVAGDTRISDNLLMPNTASIKAPELTNELVWGTWPTNEVYSWGPKAFLNDTKVKSLNVNGNTVLGGRLTINDPLWEGSAFNVKEVTGGFHTAHLEHTHPSGKGLFVNLSHSTAPVNDGYLVKASSGVPLYDEEDGEQANITTRFVVKADGKAGFNVNAPEHRFHVRIPPFPLGTNGGSVAPFVVDNDWDEQVRFGIWLFPAEINPQSDPWSPTGYRGSIGTDGERLLVKYGTNRTDWGEVVHKDKDGALPEINATAAAGSTNLLGGSLIVGASQAGNFTKTALKNTRNATYIIGNVGDDLTNWTLQDARALILPSLSGNNNKFLGVVGTNVGWVDVPVPPDEVPSISGNAEKLLRVDEYENGTEWVDPAIYTAFLTNGTADIHVNTVKVNTVKVDPSYSANEYSIGHTFSAYDADPNPLNYGFGWPGENNYDLTYIHNNNTKFRVGDNEFTTYVPLVFGSGDASTNTVLRTTRDNLGLGTNDTPFFFGVNIGSTAHNIYRMPNPPNSDRLVIQVHDNDIAYVSSNSFTIVGTKGIEFINNAVRTNTLSNLGIGGGLTTNITVLRPSSVTNTLRFTNGVLMSVTAP